MAAKVIPAPLERPLYSVAAEISADYRAQGKPVYFAAAPYVQAAGRLQDLNDRYYDDSAEDIVIRLLGNLGSWRGEVAQRVKAELKAAVNAHYVGRGKKPLY